MYQETLAEPRHARFCFVGTGDEHDETNAVRFNVQSILSLQQCSTHYGGEGREGGSEITINDEGRNKNPPF